MLFSIHQIMCTFHCREPHNYYYNENTSYNNEIHEIQRGISKIFLDKIQSRDRFDLLRALL